MVESSTLVFANAGIAQLTPFGTVDEKFYDLHFDANVKGLFSTVQKSLSALNDGASIILTASIADIKGFPGISVYSATKVAVRSFARTWTNELRERRIRVNAIRDWRNSMPAIRTRIAGRLQHPARSRRYRENSSAFQSQARVRAKMLWL
jgi:NAD(P)-dependent dehydrogenase (short-subunit alcohol dehydrogenase family)